MTTSNSRTSRHRSNWPSLPRPVQEHLGGELRLAYRQAEEKPAYLGDPVLPLAFDEPLHQLATRESARERARQRGLGAVRSALQDLLLCRSLCAKS